MVKIPVAVGCAEVVLVGNCVDVLVVTGISLVSFAVVCSVRVFVIVVPEVPQVALVVGTTVVVGFIVEPGVVLDVVGVVLITVRSSMFSLVVVGTSVAVVVA